MRPCVVALAATATLLSSASAFAPAPWPSARLQARRTLSPLSAAVPEDPEPEAAAEGAFSGFVAAFKTQLEGLSTLTMAPPGPGAAAFPIGEARGKVGPAGAAVRALFAEGFSSEAGLALFAETVVYETTRKVAPIEGLAAVTDHLVFRVNPTNGRDVPLSLELDRCDNGSAASGCTWTASDGLRGVSYYRLNAEGKIDFVREVFEPVSGKFKENNLKQLKPFIDFLKSIGLAKDVPVDIPSQVNTAPRSKRADDVVKYIWQDAQYADDYDAEVIAQFSENEALVWEDMTYVDESWPRGKDQVATYQAESRANAPPGFKFVLDDVADGVNAAALLWHCEAFGRDSPRGASYYEVDSDGKVVYVRACYRLGW